MTYLARDLIADAYYLSGVVSKSFQTVSGEQFSSGLRLLNIVLSNKATDERLIPYYTEYTLNGIIGQEEYFIPKLVEAETFTFNIGEVRYQTIQTARRAYFGSPRVDDVTSLPFRWHIERTKGGSNLFIYYKPDDTYVLKIWGKFAVEGITEGEDLEDVFDAYYTNYLKYEVAQYVCDEYGIPLPQNVATNLIAIRNRTIDTSPPDLSVTRRSRLSNQKGLNWAQVNLGQGWFPPN